MPKHLVEIEDNEDKKINNKYISNILAALKENICSDCKLKKRHFNNIYQFELPYSHTTRNFDIGDVYRLIELNKLRFNLVDYSLSQNTLDNVFVNFVKEQTKSATKKSKSSTVEDDDDDLIDQNYVDHDNDDDDEKTDQKSPKRNIQCPIHDNDDLLLDLNDSSDKTGYEISSGEYLTSSFDKF